MRIKPKNAVVLVLVSALMVAITAGPASASSDLRFVKSLRSLTGVHEWYEQTYAGYPVLGSFYGRHLDLAGRLVAVDDGRLDVSGALKARRISATDAKLVAGAGQVLASLYVLPGRARLVWATVSAAGDRTLVDAADGRFIRREREARDVDGSGRVFDPNPVVKLQNQSLTDQNNADYPAIQGAYVNRVLTNLDGSGFLRGPYADVIGTSGSGGIKKSEGIAKDPAPGGTKPPPGGSAIRAFSANNQFNYVRSNTRFEEVIAYYGVTSAQNYIQSLGFTGARSVNNEQQNVSVNTISDDNSFYSPSQDRITLGRGGVDDGEDLDIIWHELGHAIQDAQVPNFGIGLDAGSIGEGFGDYWAVTMSVPANGGYQVPCVGDWDAVSYTSAQPHCLRRTDLNLTVANRNGQIHHDGQIWSRALWQNHLDLGRTVADRIVLEAQFSYSPGTTFQQAAGRTVAAAQTLYGSAAAETVRQNFMERGITPA